MKRIVLGLSLCLPLAFALSCSTCRKEGGAAGLAEMVPGDVPGVVLLPDLSATMADFDGLMKKFSVGPAATFLNQGKLELVRRLGFDPFNPEDWRKLGVDPRRGLALVLDPGGTIVVVGVSDTKAFEAEIQRRMKELVGADQVRGSSVEGISVTSVGSKLGDRNLDQLHYAFRNGYAFLAGASIEPGQLARFVTGKAEPSLARAGWYTERARSIPADADVQVYINGPRAEAVLRAADPDLAQTVRSGLAMAFSLSPSGLSFDSFWGMDPPTAQQAVAITPEGADAHLENYLPADTFLALKVRLRADKLLDLVLQNEPEAKAELDQILAATRETLGVDIEAATLRNLTGNAVLGVSLGKPEHINAAIASQGGKAMGHAFRLQAWIQLKDGQAFAQVVEQAEQAAGDKLPATSSKVGALKVLTFPGREGVAIHVMHHKDLCGACMGEGCTEAAATLLKGQGDTLPSSFSPEAKRLFAEPSILLGYLNFGQVIDTLASLDASALGQGGMTIKIILDLAIGAIKNLRELTGVIKTRPDGLVIQGHLQIQ